MPRDLARFDPKALLEHCIARLDRNALPSYIQVVKEMPKTASEKVQERFLVDLLQQDATAVFVTGR